MKKSIYSLLLSLFVLLLCACGSVNNTTKGIGTTIKPTTKVVTTKKIEATTTIAPTTTKDDTYGELYIPNLAVYQAFPKYIPAYFSKDKYDISYTFDSSSIKIENGIITVIEPSDKAITVTATTEHHSTTFKVKACGEYVSLSSNSSNFNNKYNQRKNTVELTIRI